VWVLKSLSVSMRWSAAAAIRSPLCRVRWIRADRLPSTLCSSCCKGWSIEAASRGSLERLCTVSFATSSDWMTSRAGAPTASTR
jgi:hypothetical protein